MTIINTSKLNGLELKIHHILTKELKDNPNLTINNAADITDVSMSKISKYVKKLGFDNFKQYRLYYTDQVTIIDNKTNELRRLKSYIDNFDYKLVESFIKEINNYKFIYIYGLGPSNFVAEFFAYKLRLVSNNTFIAVNDTISLSRMINQDSLVIIISTTGKFRDFSELCNNIKSKNGEVLFLLEEYNNIESIKDYKKLYLTNSRQDQELRAFDKTRTIFFIFIEEVITEMSKQYIDDNNL